ncbi:MAG: hypothetical protein M3Q08_04775 [Pseudomonadota bacterium]|nr:hypothetical protein [Pseudomonadota bacterium]
MSPMKLIAAVMAVGLSSGASPAAAQYERSRTGQVAEEIARGVREAANAVGTVSDAFYDSVNGIRYRGQERFAISHCAPRVERYGRMRVDHVEPYGRRSLRVYGIADRADRYHAGYRARSDDRPLAFTCTVRDDGRVKFKTMRNRA